MTIAADRLQCSRVFTIALAAFAAIGIGLLKLSQADNAALGQAERRSNVEEETPVKAPANSRITVADDTKIRSRIEHDRAATKNIERCIAGGIYWLARHQLADGSWSLERYNVCCADKTCTGAGGLESFSAATAMALLPFLDAAQTQATKGPYRRTVADGIDWLVRHQKANGDLSTGAARHAQMYSHGLATLALCKDYALTKDVAYYWYYASHVMHNMQDKDWDTWNHKIQKILIDTQQREGCALGSWDPQKPNKDAWGGHYGGRLMVTSFSCQILELFGEPALPVRTEKAK